MTRTNEMTLISVVAVHSSLVLLSILLHTLSTRPKKMINDQWICSWRLFRENGFVEVS
jgi:hypothetical protein